MSWELRNVDTSNGFIAFRAMFKTLRIMNSVFGQYGHIPYVSSNLVLIHRVLGPIQLLSESVVE